MERFGHTAHVEDARVRRGRCRIGRLPKRAPHTVPYGMIGQRRWLAAVLSAASLLGCGGDPDRAEPEAVGTVTEAIGPCNETVPTTRFIDGFPAYAQCATTQNSAIYSNNGIDTATTAMGSDWVRTQGNGGYQCTELAHRYWLFKWKVTWLPRNNAGFWCDDIPPATSGVVQTTTPVHGDLIVFAPGSCGADSVTGHVAVVDTVGAAGGKLSAVQQNVASRSSYAPSCAKCFLHVVANDGSMGTAGAGGAGTAGASSGGAPPAGSGGMLGAGGSGPIGAGGFPAMGAGGTSSATGGVPVSPPLGAGGFAPANGGAPGVPPTGATGGAIASGPSPAGAAGAPASGYGGLAGAGAPPTTNQAGNNQARLSCAVSGAPSTRTSFQGLLAALGLVALFGRRRSVGLTARSPG
jgi:MYXO-CTERM domain-containing protein